MKFGPDVFLTSRGITQKMPSTAYARRLKFRMTDFSQNISNLIKKKKNGEAQSPGYMK